MGDPTTTTATAAATATVHDSDLHVHIGPTGRKFARQTPSPCYQMPAHTKYKLPDATIAAIAAVPESQREVVERIEIPARDARAWYVPAGAVCRLRVTEGPQVGDVNVWNACNTRERFYASKTRQIHAAHLTTRDSLWSCMPYVRALATVVADSVAYGVDDDNGGVHDVIGSRCDPYTNWVMRGTSGARTCHSNLTRAVLPFGLGEGDIHDVFNVFMRTGFTRGTGEYFVKPSPVVKGDFLDLFAHVDLIVAMGACPQGDVSVACGSDKEASCYGLGAEVFRVPCEVLGGWKVPGVSQYRGGHGLVLGKQF